MNDFDDYGGCLFDEAYRKEEAYYEKERRKKDQLKRRWENGFQTSSAHTEKGKMMAKEMCEDCGKVFDGGPMAFFCPNCRKKRLSQAAKKRNLNKLGNDAYSRKQAESEGGNGT